MAIVVVAATAVVTGGAALGGAMAVGAVVAGVGSVASAVAYMHDKENNTASPVGGLCGIKFFLSDE